METFRKGEDNEKGKRTEYFRNHESEAYRALHIPTVRSQHRLPYRGTADVDIVINPDPEKHIEAQSLSRWLYEENSEYFGKVDTPSSSLRANEIS